MSIAGSLLTEQSGHHTCAEQNGCIACVKYGRSQAARRIAALTVAMEAAGQAIHSEYCSGNHHRECLAVDAVLADEQSAGNAGGTDDPR